jgi:DNA (cytosine-5)-methyltransferase 1
VKVLDLFSGIGGFSLGLERAGMETVAFCEIEEFPRKVLAKHWPNIPIYNDVMTLTKERLDNDGIRSIDVICGGFPCQDISVAGNQEGIGEGTRSGLWSECARLLGEIRPKYAIFENVTALLNGGGGDWFKRVLWDISQVGYDAEWHCIPASELGAHHHRDRVWIIAYPKKLQCDGGYDNAGKLMEVLEVSESGNGGRSANVAYAKRQRQQGQGQYEQSIFAEAFKNRQTINAIAGGTPDIWKVEPELGRVANGVPARSHRLKALGNAVVPPIPQAIGRAIMSIEEGAK